MDLPDASQGETLIILRPCTTAGAGTLPEKGYGRRTPPPGGLRKMEKNMIRRHWMIQDSKKRFFKVIKSPQGFSEYYKPSLLSNLP